MNHSLLKEVEKKYLKKVPVLKTGQTVKVSQKIKEGEKERVQTFEGLVIAVKGEKGINQSILVRKIVSGVGVEKLFPIHSSTIEQIEVIKEAKVRRAKLYYMRERFGKSARLKETYLKEGEIQYLEPPATGDTPAEPEATEPDQTDDQPAVAEPEDEAKAA